MYMDAALLANGISDTKRELRPNWIWTAMWTSGNNHTDCGVLLVEIHTSKGGQVGVEEEYRKRNWMSFQ